MRSAPDAATGDAMTLFDTLVMRLSFKARATGRSHDTASAGSGAGLDTTGLHSAGAGLRSANLGGASPGSASLGSAGLKSAGLRSAGLESAGLETSTGLRVAAVLFVTVLTALASQISVPLPFTPVPFTFQPMVVLLGGAALGARLGMTSQILYLTLGLVGLPVFAASPVLPQGAARLIGPTAGFLLSYPFAAYVTGLLAERGFDRHYLTSVTAMLVGLSIVFAGGALRLAYGPPVPLGVAGAMQTAVIPFIPADLIKICLAAAVLPAAWRFLGASSPAGPR
jgi:biotin transport system substrate-specific component